jgi:hypothetical protein
MRFLWVALAVLMAGASASSDASAGYPQYGYRSSVAPRTYLYGQGAPGLYPSRFGSGFGGYNPGYSPRYYGGGYGNYGYGNQGYGNQGYGGQQIQQFNIYLGR